MRKTCVVLYRWALDVLLLTLAPFNHRRRKARRRLTCRKSERPSKKWHRRLSTTCPGGARAPTTWGTAPADPRIASAGWRARSWEPGPSSPPKRPRRSTPPWQHTRSRTFTWTYTSSSIGMVSYCSLRPSSGPNFGNLLGDLQPSFGNIHPPSGTFGNLRGPR